MIDMCEIQASKRRRDWCAGKGRQAKLKMERKISSILIILTASPQPNWFRLGLIKSGLAHLALLHGLRQVLMAKMQNRKHPLASEARRPNMVNTIAPRMLLIQRGSSFSIRTESNRQERCQTQHCTTPTILALVSAPS